jgi:hypothetical protein
VYEGVSISRKDRERMEQLLYARYLLLTACEEKVVADIARRTYASDLLLLMRVCGDEKIAERSMQILESKRTTGVRKRTRRPAARKRRRSPPKGD